MRRMIVLLAVMACVEVSAQELPPGPGRDEVTRRCVTCHETDLIAQQRLSPPGWGREVDKMTRWGAAVEAAEREAMVAYLARHFAPTAVAGEPAAVEAEGTYKRACLVCHEGRAYNGTRHALKALPRSPAATHGCESCHGPGKAHAESGGDTALIVNPAKNSVAMV